MIDLIAFDADDTLWHNEILYIRAKDALVKLLVKYASSAEIDDVLEKQEAVNLEDYGYGIKSFTLSMVEAAIQVSHERVSPREIREVMGIGRGMHRAQVELFEHTQDTLKALRKSYPLMLLTKGEPHEQQRKVKRSGLQGYFKFVEVVGEKAEENYRALLEHYRVDPRRFVMVGNSMRSDILPVLEIGGTAIYIPYEHTWSHEQVGELGNGKERFFEIEHLGYLPNLIGEIGKTE
jgi:putative hydrolase of the HAD superfamily